MVVAYQRRWLSSVSLSACVSRKFAISASTASVEEAPCALPQQRGQCIAKLSWLMTLSWDMTYHFFGEEVEASNTPTIRRLTLSCRHQLSA